MNIKTIIIGGVVVGLMASILGHYLGAVLPASSSPAAPSNQ